VIPPSRHGQRVKGQKMTIDTEIRHVIQSGTKLFRELGFSAEKANRLQAVWHKQINDTRQLKEQLMSELSS